MLWQTLHSSDATYFEVCLRVDDEVSGDGFTGVSGKANKLDGGCWSCYLTARLIMCEKM